MREREAFQEVDYKAHVRTMAKWVVEIDRPDRIPELVARAFRVAMQGRPGPVVIALPENMLTEHGCRVADAPRVEPAKAWPAPADIAKLAACSRRPKRPIVILGGSAWDGEAAAIARFAERFDLPVTTRSAAPRCFRRASELCRRTRHRPGSEAEEPHRQGADLILLIGGRMSEMPSSSYTLLEIPVPHQALVHVHPGAEELGRVYQPQLAIQATPGGIRRGARRT
jgi:acetolactate synthase-1/2/3 large subunit